MSGVSPELSFKSGLPPAQDRMLTTGFLAALVHAVLILGVTFGYQRHGGDGDAAAGLEVVLVNDQAPAAAANPNAPYLAQRSQLGSGNSRDGARTLIPRSSLAPVDSPGLPNGDGAAAAQAAAATGAEELVSSSGMTSRIVYFATPATGAESARMPLLLERRADLGMTPNDDGVQLRVRGEARKQLWIAADTRESEVAVYLNDWRRKIERVGTVNFPDVARRRGMSGTPVIEVTIGATGRLLAATVKRTSGHAELDEAALRILKLAAPYDPFPAPLATRHDAIRIAYEWQFLDGASAGSSVLYAPPATQPQPR